MRRNRDSAINPLRVGPTHRKYRADPENPNGVKDWKSFRWCATAPTATKRRSV